VVAYGIPFLLKKEDDVGETACDLSNVVFFFLVVAAINLQGGPS
jgi:hypothetical protein